MTFFFKTLDDMKVFYFSFIVERFKSAKKILKPAGASRKFWTILESQELLNDFYSKKAPRNFWSLLERQENFEPF